MIIEFDWKNYLALAFVLFLMALPVLHRKFYGQVPEKNPNDILQASQNYQLIDLRSEKVFREAHINHAINIPCEKIELCKQQILDLAANGNQKNPIVLVCDTDLVSTKLAKKLTDMKFSNVYILKGGFNFWKRKQLPLIRE